MALTLQHHIPHIPKVRYHRNRKGYWTVITNKIKRVSGPERSERSLAQSANYGSINNAQASNNEHP